MKHESDGWMDEALDTLAADDAQVKPPAHLHAAVLGEWDRQHQGRRSRRSATRAGRRRIIVWSAVSAVAAVTLAVAVLRQDPVDPSSPETMPVETAASPESLITRLPGAPLPAAGVQPPVMRRAAVPDGGWADGERGYVIVPGPLVDPTARHLVRARMSSRALATLGMPIVNPDADGLVEVEMLVGDDGVAQLIRHAAFVSDQAETGGER